MKIDRFIKKNKDKKVVAVQGLGFVGSAMLTAVAAAKSKDGRPLYAVIGVDLPKKSSYWKIEMINSGKLPVKSSDGHLSGTFEKAFKSGNVMATADTRAYAACDVLLGSINLDIEKSGRAGGKNKVCLNRFIPAMREVAKRIKPSCLVIVQSTIPPGTCEKTLVPLFKREFKKRGVNDAMLKLAYSYERVMPGKNYLKSITSYHRVFSGISNSAKKETRLFLESLIDTDSYPLTELADVTAAEIGKVLENSYRATNIAFMQEWTEFAESAGINLFEVIDGIKKRDTHKNIMLPGFGVGGYCLTKDPILADWSNIEIFNCKNPLNMTLSAVEINKKMPLHSFAILKKYLKSLNNKKILLLGISYLNDVADTRFSPSELFYNECTKGGATVIPHDPIVEHWPELAIDVIKDLREVRPGLADAVIAAVRHDEYISMKPEEYPKFLKPGGFILDSNNVIDDRKAALLRKMGFRVAGVGKGHWNRMLKA